MDEGDSMATCAVCGNAIESGGIRLGDRLLCGGECLDRARALEGGASTSHGGLTNPAMRIHAGPCPMCQGPGPVDVHDIHWVWSAVAFTRWGSRAQVSCRRCAVKSQVGGIARSALLGWWGIPWGLIITPIQIVRNIGAITRPPDPDEPSDRLRAIAREHLGDE